MSHHYSGPNVGFPRGDARLDLTDLYAFPSPADASRSVLIMNFHPSFSLLSPEPTPPEPFAADAIYEFKVDTNGDAVAEFAYRVCFSAFANGNQTAVLRRAEAPRPPRPATRADSLKSGRSRWIERRSWRKPTTIVSLPAGGAIRSFLIRLVPSMTSTSSAKTTLSTRTYAASSLSCRARLSEANRSVSGHGRLIAPTAPGFKSTAVPSHRSRFS